MHIFESDYKISLPFTKRGFTLIELLIVVAVLGIIATLFITTYPASQRRAKDTTRKNNIKQYQVALERYANRNNGSYLVATGLMSSQCSALGLGSSCPDDSVSTYRYQYRGTATQYVIYGRMEATSTYFIVCSNGKVGEAASAPSSSTCPL